MVDARNAVPGAGSFTTAASCKEGDAILSGGCVITQGSTAAVLTGGCPNDEQPVWFCFYTKANAVPTEVLARAVCLSQG